MAEEAIALLKEFYVTGNPSGALYSAASAHARLQASAAADVLSADTGLSQAAS